MKARSAEQGMTLAEVAICLGLISFALVSMLGLLPTGMVTLREARDATAEGNYLQSLNAAYLSLGFSDMPASETYYFDQDGQAVTESSPLKRYRVTVEVMAPNYPGKPAGIENSLRSLRLTARQLDGSGNPVGTERIRSLKIADGGF
jgi:uncharacterized protein (TIGR02598 family)